MDSQDHKNLAISTAHEVHICHRCGWPFPNPHPSSKHRRAHKRVCGTIEGYEVIQSEAHDPHLAALDYSDDDERTPSPKVEKRNVKEFVSSGGVGENSNKSEDDLFFSDAVTEFSDSGISANLEEKTDKSVGQKSAERDESADTIKQIHDTTILIDAVAKSETKLQINDTSSKAVSVEVDSTLQPNVSKSEIHKDVEEDLFSIQISDATHSDVLEKDLKLDSSTDMVSIESSIDEEVEKKPISCGDENKNQESGEKFSTEVEKKPVLDGGDSAIYIDKSGEKSSIIRDENKDRESKDKISAEKVSALELDNYIESEDDQTTRGLKENVDENSSILEGGIERDDGVVVEPPVPLDSSIESVNPKVDGVVDKDSLIATPENLVSSPIVSQESEIINLTSDVKVVASPEKSPEQTKELAHLSENSASDNTYTHDGDKASESVDTAKILIRENPEIPTLKFQESLPEKKECLNEKQPDVEENVIASDKFSPTPILKEETVPLPLDFQELRENYTNGDDKKTIEGENVNDDMSGGLSSGNDSVEGKWGSVSAVSSQSFIIPVAETNSQSTEKSNKTSQNPKLKSDDFEPPSFLTLVESKSAEIETVHNINQSEAVKPGWFPSLTNVVNESQGRKKNEEIIAKVTNWSSGKQHHGPLKNLLNEAKQAPTEGAPEGKGEAANPVVDSEPPKDPTAHKETEEWNSPARYPAEIKKEKKKGKSYWVPFVCCSSVHRDM